MTNIPTRARLLLLLVAAVAAAARPAAAQSPAPEEERLKILTDPEDLKKKVEKDKNRPPIELFRSQVAPFDILPYVKANHWSTLSLELRSNYDDFDGTIRTAPVALAGLPQEVVFLRDARLLRTQRVRLGLQMLLPKIPKEIPLELVRPDAIRAEEIWSANLRVLEPHQMLILFLSKETSDAYALWNRYQALYPTAADRGDLQALDRQRYYRLVMPLEPDRPPVSPHPLAWTTISHVIWDGMPADNLNPSQQQAMIDWLHWGGQLILNGGAGAAFNVLKDSFLGEYLPADAGGENATLDGEALRPLSEAYPPPVPPRGSNLDDENAVFLTEPPRTLGVQYAAPVPIRPAANRPVFLNGLTPKEGAVAIPMGDAAGRVVGVEWRVGRGRVLMLALDVNDPAMSSWPGVDTFIRRVVLRRPEEGRVPGIEPPRSGFPALRHGPLPGPDLTWFRILARDLHDPEIGRPASRDLGAGDAATPPFAGRGRVPGVLGEVEVQNPRTAVAEWFDEATLPRYCVRQLEAASGIKIPGSGFVLKVILAYIALLVPLNWLICRYVLGRREYAWVAVPLLSLAFAVGVERAAAYDVGYNSASDEIDLVEVHGGYPRAHVSRFLSLYSTGRTRFDVSYPNEPTALAMPLDNGRSLRGEDVSTASWRSYPVPALEGYLVQPRSLAFVRAEQMATLDGAIALESDGEGRRLVNGSALELRDATLIDEGAAGDRRVVRLGTVGPGATVELGGPPRPEGPPPADLSRDFDPDGLLEILRKPRDGRPEDAGAIRLVAWSPRLVPGQSIEPPVDRVRGFTAVVVHLRSGPPPSPSGPSYDALVPMPAPPPGPPPSAASAPAPTPGIAPYNPDADPILKIRRAAAPVSRVGATTAPEPTDAVEDPPR